MFKMPCFLCGRESDGKDLNTLIIYCDSCGTYEVSSPTKLFYFDQSRLDVKAREKLRDYLKMHPRAIFTSALVAQITGIPSGK